MSFANSRAFRREPGDWECRHCKEINFKSRTNCRGCSAARNQPAQNTSANTNPQNAPKPGDWNCHHCNTMNFASRNACFKCTRPKQELATPKSGDWNCHHCNTMNFASRNACFKCTRPKQELAPPKPSDWTCQACQNLNWGVRTACNRCGQARVLPSETNAPPPVTVKPGDWKCSSCPEMNFGSRVVCRGCGAARPSADNQSSNDNKSECVICMDKPIDSVITTCGHSAVCLECGTTITQCPICRNPFNREQIIKFYNVH